MSKTKVRIKLIKERPFNGVIRKPGCVLLEGIVAEGITVDKAFNALEQGCATVEVIEFKKDKEDDSEGSDNS